MSVKQKGQQENQNKERRPRGPKQAPAGAELAAVPATQQAMGLGQLPDHATARSLRRTAVLQMQQQRGNAHVQRVLGNRADRASGRRNGDDAAAGEGAHDRGAESAGAGPPSTLPLSTPPNAPNGNGPADNKTGAPGLVQRQEEEEGDEGPSEAEREAALAAAKKAEQEARKAADEGQKEVGKSKSRKTAEQEAAKRAKEKKKAEAAAARARKGGGKKAAAGRPAGAGATAGKGPTGEPGGKEPAAGDRAPASPAEDPGFQAVTGKIGKVAKREKSHAPAGKKTKEAQKAAAAPAAEIEARAQFNQVGEMEKAETPGFDEAGFKKQLMERIKAAAPSTMAEADNFKENNALGGVKVEMQGQVSQEQEKSQGPLKETAQKPPDTGSVEPKPVTPLKPAAPGGPPPTVKAEKAAPKPKTGTEVEAPLKAESQKLDQQMAENDVTEEQLAQSNEPAFQSALDAKGQAQTHAQEAPKAYRTFEQSRLSRAEADAAATTKARTQAMHGDRAQLLQAVSGRQERTKSEDEQARQKVASDIQKIYDRTKTNVEKILSDLDGDVESAFDEGAAAARQAFEDYVDAGMEAYKERRYGGWLGWARWTKDKVAGMPSEVNAFYREGRRLYLAKMDAVIDNVVSIIGRGLNEAKAEIAKGKKEIQEYVAQLPDDLKDVGRQAADDIQQQFAALEQQVEDKKGDLIDTLANKYQENLQAVDARIEEMKAANKGLVSKALDKVVGVVKTILELKNMLLGVLSRAAAAVEKIIKDPIGFLGNLVDGVKQGLENFVANIGQHLKKGLVGWLTGAMAEAGITLPESFDLKGIFKLVMQILGLTFDKIRARIVKALGFDPFGVYDQIMSLVGIYQEEGLPGLAKRGLARLIGPERMEMLMQALPLFEMALEGDFDALWGMVSERLSDLTETVFGQIQEFLAEKVIKAGITWVISLLTPAGAFVRACKMIYDIVIFFVERGKQIMALVNAIIGSLSSLASGNLSAAAQAVEDALARSIPVAISFLASLLGLGGVSKRVRTIVKGVQAKVDRALDAVFNSKPVQIVSGFIRKVVGKVKGMAAAGVAKAKSMAKAGVEKVKGLGKAGAAKAKGLLTGDKEERADRSEPTREERTRSLAAIEAEEEKYLDNGAMTRADASRVASAVQKRHPVFKRLSVVDGGDRWDYQYVFRAIKAGAQKSAAGGPEDEWLAEADDLLNRMERSKTLDVTVRGDVPQVTSIKRGPRQKGPVRRWAEKINAVLDMARKLPQPGKAVKQRAKRLTKLRDGILDELNPGQWVEEAKGAIEDLETLASVEISGDRVQRVKRADPVLEEHHLARLHELLQRAIPFRTGEAGAVPQGFQPLYRSVFNLHKSLSIEYEKAKSRSGGPMTADKLFGKANEKVIEEVKKQEQQAERSGREWVAVFPTLGRQLFRIKDEGGGSEMIPATFGSIFEAGGKGLVRLSEELYNAVAENVQESLAREEESPIRKSALDAAWDIWQTPLFLVTPTDIPRRLQVGKEGYVRVNPGYSISPRLYQAIAEANKEKVRLKYEGQIHHIVPVYLGGSHKVANLLRAKGDARAAEASVHKKLHELIEEVSLTVFARQVVEKEMAQKGPQRVDLDSLKPQELKRKIEETAGLRLLIGTLFADGDIEYVETSISAEALQQQSQSGSGGKE